MGSIYLDPIFQVPFESYVMVLGGKLALFDPRYRNNFESNHAFSIAGKLSQDSWIVFQELFDILDNKKGTWRSVSSIAPCQFLSTCWDILVKDNRYQKISSSSIIQFFRHVRNAASHGNRFNIHSELIDSTTKMLKLNAEWRGTKITPSLNAHTLIPDYMEMSDPIWLISDVSSLLK